MATGYTACIGEGATFKEFAFKAARGMGATITMRDDSMDAEIPDEFQPCDFYEKSLAKEKERLKEFSALTTEQIAERAADTVRRINESIEESKRHTSELRGKYHAMLAKVYDWQPPTPDHANFKKFMVDQITESIKWDCHDHEQKPIELTPDKWYADELENITSNIERYAEEHAKEVQRAKERSDWVKALRLSLL